MENEMDRMTREQVIENLEEEFFELQSEEGVYPLHYSHTFTNVFVNEDGTYEITLDILS